MIFDRGDNARHSSLTEEESHLFVFLQAEESHRTHLPSPSRRGLCAVALTSGGFFNGARAAPAAAPGTPLKVAAARVSPRASVGLRLAGWTLEPWTLRLGPGVAVMMIDVRYARTYLVITDYHARDTLRRTTRFLRSLTYNTLLPSAPRAPCHSTVALKVYRYTFLKMRALSTCPPRRPRVRRASPPS